MSVRRRVELPAPGELQARCASDGELRLAVRFWTGGIRFHIGDEVIGFEVVDGEFQAGLPESGPGVIELRGSVEVWEPMLAPVPPPLAHTVATMVRRGLDLHADPLTWWQYLPATERFLELLRSVDDRAAANGCDAAPPAVNGEHASPVGRYVHVPIDGNLHRLYYEEAGQGTPLLLQHTAGAHGVQWRHVFECAAITERFRVIAYDLPFHGKSLPPTSSPWWQQHYRLTGDVLRQVPLALISALDLRDPVFMGCSVGGLLALDLALHHGDVFQAVVAVEGALHIGGDLDSMIGLDHPAVSGMAKAKLMEGLCSPTSPTPFVKEVAHVYAAGWPAAFLGDLWYYAAEFDLRDRAGDIDTTRCGVHILNGEYDYSGSIERGREAHAAIAGSTHRAIDGIGHFPMVEQPDRFLADVVPLLLDIIT